MDNLAFIIFGITSNIAQKYIIHTLYDMEEKEMLPENFKIIGNARAPKTKQEIDDYILQVLQSDNKHHRHPINPEVFKKLAKKIHYIDGHLDDPQFFIRLEDFLKTFDNVNLNKIFYLATYPDLYHHIFENLKKTNLDNQDNGFVRIMVEKPIGFNLQSSQQINQLLKEYFKEDQVFRLDHYLGKETLQNILTFRFANDIFEPLINSQYVDHIQITAAEDFGIGKRGGYYDKVGALKDVGQNHQLQMLAFATMDQPSEFSNQAVTEQRLKILENLMPLPEKLVLGQYEDYKKEENIEGNSKTDTFYAYKTFINSERFKDTPVYVRAGKNLAQTVTEIAVIFKNPKQRLFGALDCGDEPNVLVYRISPGEGIRLKVLTKKPDHQMQLKPDFMQALYPQDPIVHLIPDPYERLLVETIKGDQTFFNSAEEVEAQWKFIDKLLEENPEVVTYKSGTWGPKEADNLIKSDGRQWLEFDLG